MEFFRHCPGCGRRFHIKLVSKKVIDTERTSIERPITPIKGARGGLSNLMIEGPPLVFDVEEFQYNYKCKHCGHEWSEKHLEEQRYR